MLNWEENVSSSTLPEVIPTPKKGVASLLSTEDLAPPVAVAQEVPVVEEAWDSIRQALFLPGTPLPAIQMLMSYFAEDAEIVYLATGAVLKGKAQIMDLLKRTGSSTYSFDANANEIVNQVTGNDLVSGKKTMYETVIFTLVHDQPISWLLPDVKPTRKRITVPMDIMVSFARDAVDNSLVVSSIRVFHDQGSTMKQIGLLPQSLYCKLNASETNLPVVGPRIADPLIGDRAAPLAEDEKPPSARAHIVSPNKKSRIFEQEEATMKRSSTRTFAKPTVSVFSDEPDAPRSGVAIDPRRFETHVNVFNPTEVSPNEVFERPGRKLVSVNPNLTSHMATLGISAAEEVEKPSKKMVEINPNLTSHYEAIGVSAVEDVEKPSKKMVEVNPNYSSHFSTIGVSAPPAEQDADFLKPSKKLFMEKALAKSPLEGDFQPSLRQFHRGTRSQILVGSEREDDGRRYAVDNRRPRGNESSISLWGSPSGSTAGNRTPDASTPERPSSRVLRPPGGGSSVILG